MARRKRLSPVAALGEPSGPPVETGAVRPPIASVVADAAGQAALDEVASEYAAARAEGRLVVTLPLAAIEVDHLVRDRLSADSTEMEALKASIADRGQQTPIEVEDLGNGRYGLISGWRRLEALRALKVEVTTSDFDTVRALIRNLETVSDAYVSMVEENEIRANLSFYERARIAARAAERGVYRSAEDAVRDLFRNASRAKRSKIMSFLRLYLLVDDLLRFPSALSERQGLALIKHLEANSGARARLAAALATDRPETAEDEARILSAAMAEAGRGPRPNRKAKTQEFAAPQGVRLRVAKKHVELTGVAVDDAFIADLQAWLAERLAP